MALEFVSPLDDAPVADFEDAEIARLLRPSVNDLFWIDDGTQIAAANIPTLAGITTTLQSSTAANPFIVPSVSVSSPIRWWQCPSRSTLTRLRN